MQEFREEGARKTFQKHFRMSLATRQAVMMKRLFKHRWCYVLIFVIMFTIFAAAPSHWKSQVSHVHAERDRVRAERHKSPISFDNNAVIGGNREQVQQPHHDDDMGGIDINPDVETRYDTSKPGNYEIEDPGDKTGPGAGGKAVNVDRNSRQVQEAFNDFGFNTFVSDQISLNRSIPDTRDPQCKNWHYPETLPTASVVIAFHNEGWSPLMRTMHSVLLRTPPQLLAEIIMVDDFSDKEHLKGRLDEYVKQFNGKVKILRNAEREGLIRTRSNGAHKAIGDVVVFLDAHCECNVNWLPPLLAPIKADRRVMTVPIIDGIDMTTWSYARQYGGADKHFRGIFEWGLLYKESEITPEEQERRKYKSEPFRSPTHAGGLFAIDRKWFEELGYYDDGLLIWGGEQYELSFKIWQCGGGILFVPCSHVGHVYRSRMPYSLGNHKGPIIANNLKRVVETWMDEYGQYYYAREPHIQKHDPGDLTKMKQLREKLQCKSFKWYMAHVAYDVEGKYPIQPPNVVWGEARNPETNMCLDSMGNAIPGTPGISGCHGYLGNQGFRLNEQGQMSFGEWCVTAWSDRLRSERCEFGHVDGPWQYDKTIKTIKHIQQDKCLTVVTEGKRTARLEPCTGGSNQIWEWKEIYV